MKNQRILLSALAGFLVCGPVAAQENQPARSYENPIVRLDESWLTPLAAPRIWQEREVALGARVRLASPLLSFLMAPQRVFEPLKFVSRPLEVSDRIIPALAVNEVTRQRSRLEILRLRW